MLKAGRNDPCPCGSGRKYKNCCMRQDRVTESRQLRLAQGEGLLMNALADYGRTRFTTELNEAFHLYWGGIYDPEGIPQMHSDDIRRTIDWFIHDYAVGADRRHVIDLFIETQAATYPPEAQEILAAWSHATMGLFKTLTTHPDGRLAVYDSLRQAELEIEDITLAHNVERGDLLIGRLFELGSVKRLSYTTLILPNAYEPGLVAYVAHAYTLYQDEHYQASWDQFLRANGHIFNAYLLSPKAEALRSLIGPGTRYHDPAISRDKLRAFTEQRRREQLQAQRKAEGSQPPEHRTITGIILPGAAEKEQPEQPVPQHPTILIPGRDF